MRHVCFVVLLIHPIHACRTIGVSVSTSSGAYGILSTSKVLAGDEQRHPLLALREPPSRLLSKLPLPFERRLDPSRSRRACLLDNFREPSLFGDLQRSSQHLPLPPDAPDDVELERLALRRNGRGDADLSNRGRFGAHLAAEESSWQLLLRWPTVKKMSDGVVEADRGTYQDKLPIIS